MKKAKEITRLFIISGDQLLEMYDCVMDGDLKRFESVMYQVKTDQEIKVEHPERIKPET